MQVRHRLRATGTCPNNGLPDDYVIAVHCDRVVPCEEVVAAVDGLLTVTVFQEDFTQPLAERLGCTVKTCCRHLEGGRVLTECVCGAGHAGEAAAG